MPKLGVNIDHVATLRQARCEFDPDPSTAARICERAGADSIVAHLREDRRHINDKDIRTLRKTIKTRLNLEMSLNNDIVGMYIQMIFSLNKKLFKNFMLQSFPYYPWIQSRCQQNLNLA